MMNQVWRLLPALLLLLPVSARAADGALPDAATIRARVTAAAALPTAFRETTVTVTSNGTTTTRRRIERGNDWREIVEQGPFHTESGQTKDDAWHQNDNGQTVIDEPEPGVAKADPTTTTVSRVSTPVDAYVVSELNLRGHGTRRFVDPATWRIVRREIVTANGTITTTYDDFRPDGGRVFAHHWATKDDYARTSSETRVTAYDAAPVADDEIAMPSSRRMLVEFPATAHKVALPAKFGRDHVFVRVTIKGRGLDFVLDTGADGITLDNRVARELGLPVYAQRSAVTAQRYDTGRTIVPEMNVGQLTMRNVAVQLVPDGMQEGYGVKSVGLMGFDFLAELGLTVDYEHEKVVAVPATDFVAPAGPHVIPLDVRIGEGSPFVVVAINGAISERFLLDTGGAGAFMIFDAFARKHPEALKDKGGGGYARQMMFEGVGGPIKTEPYQLGSVKLGPINFQDFVGYRVTALHSYAGDYDGIIGVDFLQLFTLGLDYANSRVYLVPNAFGRKAMGIRD